MTNSQQNRNSRQFRFKSNRTFLTTLRSIGLTASVFTLLLGPLAQTEAHADVDRYLLNPFAGLQTLNPQVQVEQIERGTNTVHSTFSFTSPLASAVFDLVRYMRLNEIATDEAELEASIPRYNRIESFGRWVNEDSPANCYNTRAEVLIRDASEPHGISFSAANPCQVSKGDWLDPYSGTRFKLAKAVQVDHVVPLKNAYRSGAHQWPKERRCHYSNFLQDPLHLLSVSGRENMSKGDSGPDAYIPPNESYVCSYLKNWMRIKAVWSLGFTEAESNAIYGALTAYRCDASHTQIPSAELATIRVATNRMNVKCVENTEDAAKALSTADARP